MFNQRFGNDSARLKRDLLFNAKGGLTWKPGLWEDIRRMIVPQSVNKVMFCCLGFSVGILLNDAGKSGTFRFSRQSTRMIISIL
jgi:Family of unknown function (DUF5923)